MTTSQTTSAGAPPLFSSRGAHLVMALAIAGAFVGFFIGISRRPTATTSAALAIDASSEPQHTPTDVQPALSYTEVAAQRLGPNRNWTSDISTLVQGTPGLLDEIVLSPEDKVRALAQRAARRAYNGAPPVVPHSIDQLSSDACMVCHEVGLRVENRIAAVMPHPYLTNCTQCHVEQQMPDLEPFVLANNTFNGKPAPFEGPRAWPGAPPVIPHTMHMRNNCNACHGVNSLHGMRTTHPWRTSCTQCHAPSSTLNQEPMQAARFLPPPTLEGDTAP